MSQMSFEIERRTFEPDCDTMELYAYAGESALYNHVFVMFYSRGEAVYVFRTNPDQAALYKRLSTYIVDNECQTHLDLPEVSEEDMEAYVAQTKGYFAVLDCIPEWLE